jgi:hypothetical protein
VAVLVAFGTCAALAGDKRPREYLDEETAATITVVGDPLVFACAQPNLAANVRDYVTLAAAAVKARHLTIVADSDGAPLSYELWEDRRTALRTFVHHMNGDE